MYMYMYHHYIHVHVHMIDIVTYQFYYHSLLL